MQFLTDWIEISQNQVEARTDLLAVKVILGWGLAIAEVETGLDIGRVRRGEVEAVQTLRCGRETDATVVPLVEQTLAGQLVSTACVPAGLVRVVHNVTGLVGFSAHCTRTHTHTHYNLDMT